MLTNATTEGTAITENGNAEEKQPLMGHGWTQMRTKTGLNLCSSVPHLWLNFFRRGLCGFSSSFYRSRVSLLPMPRNASFSASTFVARRSASFTSMICFMNSSVRC